MYINKHKTILCLKYNEDESLNKCSYGEKCLFAHSNNELRCIFDDDCSNKYCERVHLKRDKNIITKIKENKKDENYNKIDIKDEKEFPIINNYVKNMEDTKKLYSDIVKEENNEDNTTIYKYSNNLTSNLKNVLNIKSDDNNNLEEKERKLTDINKSLQDLNRELSQIDKNDWTNSIEVQDIEEKMEYLELKKKNLEKEINILKSEKKDISKFNDKVNESKLPEISVTITEINIKNNSKNKGEILISLDNIEKDFLSFNENVKQKINYKVKDEYHKFMLLNNLNNISSKISLFRNNYEDIIRYN